MSPSTPPSFRCQTCRSTTVKPRNLIIFIDGTLNNASEKNTNVFKLFTNVTLPAANDTGVVQHTYYLMAIGARNVGHLPSLSHTQTKISNGLETTLVRDRYVGENVKDAYGWLADTYREGDQIYLFGFSQGAYQVRTLTGMIHEVGLVKAAVNCEAAYERYLSIDFYKLQERSSITQFKTEFCWPGVRIHFIGIWDTVSSSGLVKKKVHITAASVTDACHIRHALSFDERRVKFLREYFWAMNAHHNNLRRPRSTVNDVKEFWFAGDRSDVGGGDCEPDPVVAYIEGDVLGSSSIGLGIHVPFEWMRTEAAANGLVFESNEIAWNLQDTDLHTKKSWWKVLGFLPVLSQAFFRCTGEHGHRLRSVTPGQQIHPSIFPADAYTPYATLANSGRLPIILWRPSEQLDMIMDERARMGLLEGLLRDQQRTLSSLGKVLSLIESMKYEAPSNGQTQTKPRPQWTLSDLQSRPFVKYALTVIYDTISNVAVSEELLSGARDSLCTVLQSPPDHPEFTQALYVLRFSAKHPRLRRRFVDDCVIGALMVALEQTAEGLSEILFLLVVDSLCYLIADENLSHGIIDQLHAATDGTNSIQTRVSLALDVEAPIHLMASLKMISRLAEYRPDLCEEFKPKLYEFAKRKRDRVGSAAVTALLAMSAPPEEITREVYIGNTLGYLTNMLPPLDVEIDRPPSADNTDGLPAILWVNGRLNQEFMSKLVSIIESYNAYERTAATLTLLKLCKYPMVREFCTQNMILDIFVKQLEQEQTSLLAAYSLMKCLKYNMWTPYYYSRVAPHLISMVEKNWFDDAIGRVEGSEIFHGLMTSVGLRDRVMDFRIVSILIKTIASGERDRIRMGLACIDILDMESPVDLTDSVGESIAYLENKDKNVRMKGVKIISSLAQTAAGERAIKERVKDIIGLLPRELSGGRTPLHSRTDSVSAVLYHLAKNETLREHIKNTREFTDWKQCQRRAG